jgi:hypothetical protein
VMCRLNSSVTKSSDLLIFSEINTLQVGLCTILDYGTVLIMMYHNLLLFNMMCSRDHYILISHLFQLRLYINEDSNTTPDAEA